MRMASLGSPLDDQLADVEGLRVSLGRMGLEAADAEQRQEGLGGEPGPLALRREAAQEQVGLSAGGRLRQTDERVGRPEVALELRDLVAPDRRRPDDLPRELGEEAVVLVRVVERWRQHEIRAESVDGRDELLLRGGEVAG